MKAITVRPIFTEAVIGCGGVELSKPALDHEKLSPQIASIVDVQHDESFKFRALSASAVMAFDGQTD